MAKHLELIVAVYADADRAATIVHMLQQMHRATTITLADAASVAKDAEGNVHVVETREVTTGKGAKRGAIAAGIFGLLFPPSLIASAVAGGAVGAAWGALRDTGIKSGSLKDLGEQLTPGQAAVLALAEPEWIPTIERALEGYAGQLVRRSLSAAEISGSN